MLQFLQECTSPIDENYSGEKTRRSTVYEAYKYYCRKNGIKHIDSSAKFKATVENYNKGSVISTGNVPKYTQFVLNDYGYQLIAYVDVESVSMPTSTPVQEHPKTGVTPFLF